MNKYNDIQWVVQNNLTKQELMDDLKGGCKAIGVDHIEVLVVPFSDELPSFPTVKKSIFYGSTTMMNNVYKDPNLNSGLFFNDETFTMEKYFSVWGKHMLNYDAGITSFRELMKKDYQPDQILFIRPNDDSKSFAGEVVEFSRIESWYKNLIGYENIILTLDTKIVAGEPYGIKKEWRLWIVNKKVISSSQYKDGQFLKKIKDAPENVISFAESRCQEYTPHDVFVMDICLCGDELFILECGCMNSAGFYAADVHKIVKSVTEYFFQKMKFPKLTELELKAINEFGQEKTKRLSELLKDFDLDKEINNLKMETKTSNEWNKDLSDYLKLIDEKNYYTVYDPDGWDRSNFQFSWYEEKITKQEFLKRMMSSTCVSNTSSENMDKWRKI